MSEIHKLERQWQTDPRWQGITRSFSARQVLRLRPSISIEYSLANWGSQTLWSYLQDEEDFVQALGALTGSQAVQMAKAGLKSVYVSGWQIAADANLAGQTYPDQGFYPNNSGPQLVRRINNALLKCDQFEKVKSGGVKRGRYLPIVADAETGFGGPLHAYELTCQFIEAGVSGLHFEDQAPAYKKCGHLGGKVLVPTSQFISTLIAARLAADVCNVPLIIIARTDSRNGQYLTSDIDESDKPFIVEGRTEEGFYCIRGGMQMAISRALAFAPYADMIWYETNKPDLHEAIDFAAAVHKEFPGKLLAYNCSPSFNWKQNMTEAELLQFQRKLSEHGFKFQFITLAGWHSVNFHMFQLSKRYLEEGMLAYSNFQSEEFNCEPEGYTAVKHQQEVGNHFYDEVLNTILSGKAATLSMEGSTEEEQFFSAFNGHGV